VEHVKVGNCYKFPRFDVNLTAPGFAALKPLMFITRH